MTIQKIKTAPQEAFASKALPTSAKTSSQAGAGDGFSRTGKTVAAAVTGFLMLGRCPTTQGRALQGLASVPDVCADFNAPITQYNDTAAVNGNSTALRNPPECRSIVNERAYLNGLTGAGSTKCVAQSYPKPCGDFHFVGNATNTSQPLLGEGLPQGCYTGLQNPTPSNFCGVTLKKTGCLSLQTLPEARGDAWKEHWGNSTANVKPDCYPPECRGLLIGETPKGTFCGE